MTTEAVPDLAPVEGPAVPEPSTPSNIVHVGKCRCPNRQHADGDVVILHAETTIPLGVAALSVIRQGGGVAAVYGGLAEVYLQLGIAAWSFVDAKGEPEPITAANIARLLPFNDGGLAVADAADDLYAGDVMRPLRKERPELFPSGPTDDSTSAIPAPGSTRPTPSGRSSQNGTHGKRSAGRGR